MNNRQPDQWNELVRKAVYEKDSDAFTEVMESCRQDMLKVAMSYSLSDADCADVLQETIIACWEHLDQVRQPAYFKTWMIRILINKAKDQLRRSERYVYTDQIPESGREDLSDMEFRELLGLLDEKYRTVIILYYAEGFNTREIAEILGISVPAVKIRLRRARQQFRREYER